MPGLPGAHHSLVSSGLAAMRPAQRVLPPARPDHQDPHRHTSAASVAAASSIGLRAWTTPPAPAANATNIPEFTVSEISGAVKRTLEGAFGRVRVRGEITELKRYPSGHIYFSLKDEGGKTRRRSSGRSAVARLGLEPGERRRGDRHRPDHRLRRAVVATSSIVERLEYAGAGALLARIEMLRLRLAAEGLFDAARKRAAAGAAAR